jgi:hypothetical protein
MTEPALRKQTFSRKLLHVVGGANLPPPADVLVIYHLGKPSDN